MDAAILVQLALLLALAAGIAFTVSTVHLWCVWFPRGGVADPTLPIAEGRLRRLDRAAFGMLLLGAALTLLACWLAPVATDPSLDPRPGFTGTFGGAVGVALAPWWVPRGTPPDRRQSMVYVATGVAWMLVALGLGGGALGVLGGDLLFGWLRG